MKDFHFQVDLKGLISLLSDHLYSSNTVFLRELLQNGADAVEARKQLEPDFDRGRITVEYTEENEIIFTDNGIGLTEGELHQFLAVIGQSSKRGSDVRGSFIGQFGIGLLSCFLAADEIQVTTCSARDKTCHRWIGRSDGTYEVTEADEEMEPGSRVRLSLKKNVVWQFGRLSVKEALSSYGFLLPVPIEYRCLGKEELINHVPAPWKQEFCTKGDILEFGEMMFQESFLDAVPIKGEGLAGYAFISQRPVGAGQSLSHRIYLRSMFLTEDGKDLIPKWAGFACCIVDGTDLTPTASREGLQRDGTLLKAKSAIEKCLLDYLTQLTRFDLSRMKQLAAIHNLSLKAFSLENSKVLKLLFPFLIFTTNKGSLTGAQILEVCKKRSVFYCIDVDTFRRITPLLEYSKSLLVNAGYIYEADIFRELQKGNPQIPIKLFDDSLLDGLFENPDEEIERSLEAFRLEAEEELRKKGCRAAVKHLSPPELPALFVEGEGFSLGLEVKTSLDDYDFSFLDGFSGLDSLAGEEQSSVLYLNCDNSLIKNLTRVSDLQALRAVARVLYVQARLGGHFSVSPEELSWLSSGLSEIIAYGIERF